MVFHSGAKESSHHLQMYFRLQQTFFFVHTIVKKKIKKKKAGKRLWIVACIYSDIASQSLMTTYIETCPKHKPTLWWRFLKVWIIEVWGFFFSSTVFLFPSVLQGAWIRSRSAKMQGELPILPGSPKAMNAAILPAPQQPFSKLSVCFNSLLWARDPP